MKKLIIILLMAAPLFAQESLKVLTYNIQGMRPGSNWQVRLLFMIQFMEELDPDILLLQEVNETMTGENNMARTIAEELGEHFGAEYHYFFAQTHIAWDQFREGVGIVSKYPVLEEGARSLPRGTFLRKVVWNRVDSPIGVVNVFSTHLSFGDQDAVRLQQAEAIRGYVTEIEEAYPSDAAILGGDFNTSPNTPPITLLTNTETDTFYYDTWAELRPGEAGFTVPPESPSDRIDYIFYLNTGSAEMDTCTIEMDQTYDATHFTSDHLGVITVFSREVEAVPERDEDAIPRRHGLLQNYPNPFNDVTTIPYQLSNETHVRIGVFNLIGERIVTLVDGRRGEGSHAVRWLPAGVGSGSYVFRVEAGDELMTRMGVYLK